jgi:hypothetical protein
MSTEQIIAEIEWLERLFRLPDNRTFHIVYCAIKKQRDNRTGISELFPRLPRQEWLEELLKLPDDRPLRP